MKSSPLYVFYTEKVTPWAEEYSGIYGNLTKFLPFPGILYINPTDLGWNPPVSSWIDKREVQTERANLTILFDKYLPTCLDTLRTR